jgi:hypothetical protein
MSNKIQFGLTSWDTTDVKKAPKEKNENLFMRLDNGNNVIRLVTKPHEYLVHRYKVDEKDPGFGERVLSSLFHGSDPLVDLGSKPKRRWLVGIIDRKTQSYKILDMSVSVFKSIQELVRDEDWGDPTQYDIDVKVDKNGGATGYYTVIPKSKKPLSKDDLDIKEKADLDDLKRRCTPPTPAQVQERIDAIKAKRSGTPVASNSAGSASSKSAHDDDDDGDEDFPPVA